MKEKNSLPGIPQSCSEQSLVSLLAEFVPTVLSIRLPSVVVLDQPSDEVIGTQNSSSNQLSYGTEERFG